MQVARPLLKKTPSDTLEEVSMKMDPQLILFASEPFDEKDVVEISASAVPIESFLTFSSSNSSTLKESLEFEIKEKSETECTGSTLGDQNQRESNNTVETTVQPDKDQPTMISELQMEINRFSNQIHQHQSRNYELLLRNQTLCNQNDTLRQEALRLCQSYQREILRLRFENQRLLTLANDQAKTSPVVNQEEVIPFHETQKDQTTNNNKSNTAESAPRHVENTVTTTGAIAKPRNNSRWQEKFDELVKFKQENGHMKVPQGTTLGQWISNQRTHFRLKQENKYSSMTDERIADLLSIGFQWRARPKTLKEEEREKKQALKSANEIVCLKEECVPPQPSPDQEADSILKTDSQQKTEADLSHSKENTDAVMKDATACVEKPMSEISFHPGKEIAQSNDSDCQTQKVQSHQEEGIKVSTAAPTNCHVDDQNMDLSDTASQISLSNRWQEKLGELIMFKEKNGHMRMSANSSLGRWVSNQRTHYRLKQENKYSIMTPERITALESIGFDWRPKIRSTWDDHFQELSNYKDAHGHTFVPQKQGALGRWVNAQRTNYKLYKENKQSPMTRERIILLESIGFQWRARRKSGSVWETFFQDLVDFKERYGHTLVPSDGTHSELSHWVNAQRSNYKLFRVNKASNITPERCKLLTSIGFAWSPRTITESTSADQQVQVSVVDVQVEQAKTQVQAIKVTSD